MSQGLRDLLANRRFAIPLIGLLAFCFIGLILVGIVLILRPGEDNGSDLVAAVAASATATESNPPTFTPSPTSTRTPRPSPTLVPVGTSDSASIQQATATDEPAPTAEEATVAPTATSASGGSVVQQATATPVSQDEELAETGLGWGLIVFSGLGLALLGVGARRLRLAG